VELESDIRSGSLQLGGEIEIRLGRIWVAGGVVVEDDERGGVLEKAVAEHFPRRGERGVQRPDEDLPLRDEAVAGVHEDGAEVLLEVVSVLGDEPAAEGLDGDGLLEGFDLDGAEPPREFEERFNARETDRRETCQFRSVREALEALRVKSVRSDRCQLETVESRLPFPDQKK
jgi:hypothetical protein